MDQKEALLERFLRYVAVPTQSDPKAATVPSNPKEFDLARLLADELKTMGFVDVEVSEYAVVTGKLPSNLPRARRPRRWAGARTWTPSTSVSPATFIRR